MIKGVAQAQEDKGEEHEYYDEESDEEDDSHEPAQGTQQNVAVAGRKNDERKF